MDPIIRRPGRGGGSGTKTKSEKLESEKKGKILTRRVDTEERLWRRCECGGAEERDERSERLRCSNEEANLTVCKGQIPLRCCAERLSSGNHVDEAGWGLACCWDRVGGLGLCVWLELWRGEGRLGCGLATCGFVRVGVFWHGADGKDRRAFEAVAVVAVFEILPEGADWAAILGVIEVGCGRLLHAWSSGELGWCDARGGALVRGEGCVARAIARSTLPTILN